MPRIYIGLGFPWAFKEIEGMSDPKPDHHIKDIKIRRLVPTLKEVVTPPH